MTVLRRCRVGLLVAMGLMAVGGTAGATDTPFECTATANGGTQWEVVATEPAPTLLPHPDTGLLVDGTTMTYFVTGPVPDHTVVEATHDVIVDPSNAVKISPPGEPDTRIKTAGGSSAMQAVRANPASPSQQNVTKYTLTVVGEKEPVSSTIYIQDGNRLGRCLIASLGEDPVSPLAPGEGVETSITLKTLGNCFVTIPRDGGTGALGDAFFVDENGNALDPADAPCEFLTNREDQQKIFFFVDDPANPGSMINAGQIIFTTENDEGVGFKVGEDSCYTKFYQPPGINYTWCTKK